MEGIEQLRRVDGVQSRLPRWLLNAALACMLLEAAANWSPWMLWLDTHAPWAQAVVCTFGAVVFYVGLLRGMKPLYKPMSAMWWVVIALNLAGFLTTLVTAIPAEVGLGVAVLLMLVYVPLGVAIAIFYRGRLQQVGIWMVLYILISSIVPVVSFLLLGPAAGMDNLPMEVLTIGVVAVYGIVMRRVLR